MTALPITGRDITRGRRPQDSRARLLAAARKLFVERGYHATRPQDISRDAGLGHGTFYLHFTDKRACFLAFVEEARAELDAVLSTHTAEATDLTTAVRGTLQAIYDYGTANPGVLVTAMNDAAVIAAEQASSETLVDKWAMDWAGMLKTLSPSGATVSDADAAIIGAAVVGIIHEGSAYAQRRGGSPQSAIDLLTRLIVKALS
jgi:AcrR family transcriptional regulator